MLQVGVLAIAGRGQRRDRGIAPGCGGVLRAGRIGQGRGGGHPSECNTAGDIAAHTSPFFMRSASLSMLRQASAMMVSVGFLWALEVKTPPSATTTLSTSQVRPKLSVTESAALLPIRVVPTS